MRLILRPSQQAYTRLVVGFAYPIWYTKSVGSSSLKRNNSPVETQACWFSTHLSLEMM